LLFYVFDVLAYRGRNLLREPLALRREVLSEMFKGIKAAPIALSESLNASPEELVRVAKEFGFEGIVAKRKDSVYESSKRTGAWVKYKVNRGQEFVIGGYTPDNPFDALIVGYYEGERLLYAAKVRNGKEEMKNCVWLKPELVAQIEFTEWTPDNHLRHSKFVGLRDVALSDDKDARIIVRENEG
jgi:ATP-dependent DNA ligase